MMDEKWLKKKQTNPRRILSTGRRRHGCYLCLCGLNVRFSTAWVWCFEKYLLYKLGLRYFWILLRLGLEYFSLSTIRTHRYTYITSLTFSQTSRLSTCYLITDVVTDMFIIIFLNFILILTNTKYGKNIV